MKTALFMIRTRCNYSQSLAAQTIGVSRQLFSAWESGTKQIPAVRKEQLARLFGIDAVLLSASNLTKVEQFCDRPMFSHVIHGRQVFSFAPVGAARIYLGAPDLQRPEERGNIAIARKNAILQSLDQQITLRPGRQADDLPQLETVVSALDCLERLVHLFAELDSDTALHALMLLKKHLELLAAVFGVEQEGFEMSAEDLQQVHIIRARWERKNRQTMDQRRLEHIPELSNNRSVLESQLLAFYERAKHDGWNRVELQGYLNKLFCEVDVDETN